MIKIIYKLTLAISLVLLVTTVVTNIESVQAASATTLRELKAELADLKTQKTESNNNTTYTQSQINEKNKTIAEAYASIEKAENEIEASKIKIEESNEDIKELSVIAGELIVLYEQMQQQDSYMEIVTGASSLTDLILKMDSINFILDYNRENINKLESLIAENEAEQISLDKKQKELSASIITYEEQISDLQYDLQYFAEITEDIDDQIKNQNALIEYYEDLGCDLDQNLEDCVTIANNVSWLKPTTSGTITSAYGYRYIWGAYSFHNGIDVGGNAEGTPIYSTSSGTVSAVTYRSSCGGTKVYVHTYVNGEPFTVVYMHLLNHYVSVGDKVTGDTQIGTVGGGSQTYWDTCTTGAHLHYGVAKGFYLGGGADGYSSYTTYVSKMIEPPGFPDKYGKYSSRTQWFD